MPPDKTLKSAASDHQVDKRPLVGTWVLECYRRISSGEIMYPFGEDAMGWIQYGDDGRVSATLCRAHRSHFTIPVADDWAGDPGEWAEAAQTYLAYTGKWAVIGDTVHHNVDACTYPNWVGKTLVRQIVFGGTPELPALLLTTQPGEFSRSGDTFSELSWTRLRH